MDPQDLVAATLTWAQDPAESERLRRSMSALASHGFPAVVAARPGEGRLEAHLARLPGVEVLRPPPPYSVAAQARSSVRGALALARRTGARHLLYTEPDKEWFFRERLDVFLRRARDNACCMWSD